MPERRSRSNVEKLDRLSPLQKVRILSKPDTLDKSRLPGLPKDLVLTSSNHRIDASGGIIMSPLVMGRPCFGQPVVHARFYDRLKVRDKNGVLRPTRCKSCPIEARCAEVAERRIHSFPELKERYANYLRAGGAQGLREPKQAPGAKTAFERLVRACDRHGGFPSVNDAAVAEEYDRLAAIERQKRAAYMRRQRAKGIAAGLIDDALEAKLFEHRDWRLKALVWLVSNKAALGKSLPSKLNRLPIASCDRVADVWLAREVLMITGESAGKRAVASEMIRRFPGKYPNPEHLRKKAGSDLDRIGLLEMFLVGSKLTPVWPAFDRDDAIASTHPASFCDDGLEDHSGDVAPLAHEGNLNPAAVCKILDDDDENDAACALTEENIMTSAMDQTPSARSANDTDDDIEFAIAQLGDLCLLNERPNLSFDKPVAGA